MLHKNRTWQVTDWNLTIEQLAIIARESGWNFCLCQAFHLVVDGREIYFLNDSNEPDPLHYYQEYAPVIMTEKTEVAPGKFVCTGQQIESFTVNMEGGASLLELLRTLGDPGQDCGAHAVTFHLDDGEKHTCQHCM